MNADDQRASDNDKHVGVSGSGDGIGETTEGTTHLAGGKGRGGSFEDI